MSNAGPARTHKGLFALGFLLVVTLAGCGRSRDGGAGTDETERLNRTADLLSVYFDGLAVRVAAFDDEARIADRAGFEIVVDYASLPSDSAPSATELLDDYDVHFTFSDKAEERLQLSRYIPYVAVDFGDGIRGQVLHWDPTLMEELRRWGAEVADVEEMLDRMLEAFPRLDPEQREAYFDRLERFYFRYVEDPAREQGFRRLLDAGSTTPRQPNLIIVLVDTLRADHLGYHGYARDTSPTIDGRAGESIVLMSHFSHASRTGPSVASLITGLHPRSHGVVNPLTHHDAKGTLAAEQQTLAEILSANGYECHGHVANLNVGPRFGFGQGFDSYDFVGSGSALDVSRAAVETLRAVREPFFLYLHYFEPHDPYEAPRGYASMFVDAAYDGPVTGTHAQLEEIVGGSFDPDRGDRGQLVGLYDQEIRAFDDYFASLLEFVEERGLLDDTILLFVSDHGEELLDHGSALHGYTLYDEQLHVPCFIRDARRSARRIHGVTRMVDLLPTLLDLLGVSYDGALQGRDLMPLIDGRAEPLPAPVLSQASLRAVKTVQLQSLRRDGWKIIETTVPTSRIELYDVVNDPFEQRDLAGKEPSRTREMLSDLHEFSESLPVGTGGVVELTDEEKERLRALGYLPRS
jgi:arylsulfatase A-like enzyme